MSCHFQIAKGMSMEKKVIDVLREIGKGPLEAIYDRAKVNKWITDKKIIEEICQRSEKIIQTKDGEWTISEGDE